LTKITLRHNGIEETLKCYKVEQTDHSEKDYSDKEGISTTLCGLSTTHIDVDSEVFRQATAGRTGEYYGISQSMADPRAKHSEEYPKNVIPPNSDIEVV